MALKTDPLRDVEFLAEALLLLRDGMLISVSPPFSLFEWLLDKLHWPQSQRRRHIARSQLERLSEAGLDLEPSFWSGLRYQTSLVDQVSSFALRENDCWSFASLDDLYGGIKTCSALHISDPSPDRIIVGSQRLIQKHRPAIFLSSCQPERRRTVDILRALRPFEYTCFSNREPLDEILFEGGFIVALPPELAALSGWQNHGMTARQKPLRALVASWQGAMGAVRAEMRNWSCRIDAPDLLTSGMHPIDYQRLPVVRWTGPHKSASVALFFPIAGTYRISVEVREYAFDDTKGLGQLRIGNLTKGSTFWSDFSEHRIEAIYDIDETSVGEASIMTIITPGLGWRSIGDRRFLAGAALSKVNVSRTTEVSDAENFDLAKQEGGDVGN